MLKVKVKVGRISNLSDARYCAGMGVDILGFSIGGVRDTIDPEKYKEITGWLSGPEFVLEWSGPGIPDDFAAMLQTYNASLVQINVEDVRNIPSLPVQWIVSVPINAWDSVREQLRASKARIAYILLFGFESPLLDPMVSEIAKEFPVLVHCVGIENLDRVVSLPVAGIALDGTPERRPGVSDYASLSGILERLELAE